MDRKRVSRLVDELEALFHDLAVEAIFNRMFPQKQGWDTWRTAARLVADIIEAGALSGPEFARLRSKARLAAESPRHDWLAVLDSAVETLPPPAEPGDITKGWLSVPHELAKIVRTELAAQNEPPAVPPVKAGEPAVDGPLPPDGFRWQGSDYWGLTPKPWAAVKCLWGENGPGAGKAAAEFSELAGPVWGDREEFISPERAGSIRREANEFFECHAIPFVLSVSAGRLVLSPCDRGRKTQKPAKRPKTPARRPRDARR